MIVFDGVTKRYGRREVLRGLDASVPDASVTALVGPNSAGKTTLLKLLLGLARPDAGRIVVAGAPIGADPEYRRAIGYMPQIVRYPAHETGRSLLARLQRLRGERMPPDLTLLEAFRLEDQFDRPLGVLSGGTRQRINAVLALAFRPRLLVLDEPTAGLDPLGARIFKDRLLAERRAGTTVLVTSHVLPELEEIADRVLYLADGRTAWEGEALALQQRTGTASLERAITALLAGTVHLAAA